VRKPAGERMAMSFQGWRWRRSSSPVRMRPARPLRASSRNCGVEKVAALDALFDREIVIELRAARTERSSSATGADVMRR